MVVEKKAVSEELAKVDAMLRQRLAVHRENMASCRRLQRGLEELSRRAPTDSAAAAALARAHAMIRASAPTVEALRRQVEQRLEQLARSGAKSSSHTSAARRMTDRLA